MSDGERIVEANGVPLCVETFGDPGDPAVLLIHGASASLLWWEAELCRRIASAGRHVIRFDNRDTGRSISYPAGEPDYTMRDLADDAVGLLDTLGIERAHLVGRSMAGGIVSLAAQHHPERVRSATLVSTTNGDPDLPPMSADFVAYTGSVGPDPADHPAVVEFIVGLTRVYSGPSPYYDEAAMRRLALRDVERTVNIPACQVNHFLIDTSGVRYRDIAAPTLVVHGDQDPVFPVEHGLALRAEVPGAQLLILERMGHELPPPVWDVFVPALIAHTAPD